MELIKDLTALAVANSVIVLFVAYMASYHLDWIDWLIFLWPWAAVIFVVVVKLRDCK